MNGNDLNRADVLSEDAIETVDDMFEYHAWSDAQKMQGADIRTILSAAVKSIIRNVPPSADRSAAIRKIREARMDCNSAITHGGKY